MLKFSFQGFLLFTITLFVSAALETSAFAGPEDFVEGQMKYRVLPDGKKDFSYTWDAEIKHIKIRLGLVWDNYNPAIHGIGFNLNKTDGARPIYPDESETCRFYKGYGSIPGAADLNNNEIYLEFAGETCLEDITSALNVETLAVSFYNVRAWNNDNEMTGVFRLQMYDSPY